MAHHRSNCFVCFARPLLRFGCIGITPFHFNCPHSKIPTKASFRLSRFLTILTFLLSLIMGAVILDNIRLYIISKANYMERLMLLNDCGLCYVSHTFLLINSINRKLKMKELRGLVAITQKSSLYGITFFTPKFVAISWTGVYLSIFLFVILESNTMVVLIGSNQDTAAIKTFVSGSTFLLGGSASLHFLVLLSLYFKMFKRVHLQIKLTLNRHLHKNYYADVSQTLLKKQLRNLQRMHSSIFLNFMETQRYLSSIGLISYITAVAVVVVTNLFLIRCIQHSDECVSDYTLQAAKVYLNIAAAVVVLTLAEINTSVVSLLFFMCY